MLGTHFEPRRNEMSHICDISLLRVKQQIGRVRQEHMQCMASTCNTYIVRINVIKQLANLDGNKHLKFTRKAC